MRKRKRRRGKRGRRKEVRKRKKERKRSKITHYHGIQLPLLWGCIPSSSGQLGQEAAC